MKKNLLRVAALASATLIISLSGCKKESVVKSNDVTDRSAKVAKEDPMVLVPGGRLIPKSRVHLIENGYHLAVSNGHVLKIQNATGKSVLDFGEGNMSPDGLKPNNQSLVVNDFRKHPAQGPAGAPGWMAYSEWDYTGTGVITSFSTSWVVPTSPTTHNNQLIYIFNGVSQSVGGNIIQPVLQYGSNTVFGGYSWTLSCWYAWQTGTTWTYAYTTPELNIADGTPLTGLITYLGMTGASYNYACGFSGHTNSMSVIIGTTYNNLAGGTVNLPSIPAEKSAYEVLEAYHYVAGTSTFEVANLSDYPPQFSVAMKSIALQVGGTTASMTWSPFTGANAAFGETANIASSNAAGTGEVDLYFKPATVFNVSSSYTASTTGFSIADGGTSIASGKTCGGSTHLVSTFSTTGLPVNTNATITMTITGGHIPTNAFLNWGPGLTSSGVIVGSTITFNGVNIKALPPTETINISLQ